MAKSQSALFTKMGIMLTSNGYSRINLGETLSFEFEMSLTGRLFRTEKFMITTLQNQLPDFMIVMASLQGDIERAEMSYSEFIREFGLHDTKEQRLNHQKCRLEAKKLRRVLGPDFCVFKNLDMVAIEHELAEPMPF